MSLMRFCGGGTMRIRGSVRRWRIGSRHAESCVAGCPADWLADVVWDRIKGAVMGVGGG